MPLSMANPNEELTIKRITGDEKMRKHLHNLGFVEGTSLKIINKINENVIVKLKNVSMAITYDLAKRIMV